MKPTRPRQRMQLSCQTLQPHPRRDIFDTLTIWLETPTPGLTPPGLQGIA